MVRSSAELEPEIKIGPLKGIVGLKAVIVIIVGSAFSVCTTTLFIEAPMIDRLFVIIWIPIVIIVLSIILLKHDTKKPEVKMKLIRKKIPHG